MMRPVLEVEGLTRRFGALMANDDVTLDLRPREVHAVIGPNGAGKSTLIAQICGGLKSDAGSVRLQGQDITHETTKNRARLGLGRTFQISALASEDTVLQNAMLGALGAKGRPWQFFLPVLGDKNLRDHAENALRRVDLIDFADKRTGELSHGQRRQLEVAVALTLEPKVFILDEPMAGLSAEGTRLLTNLLSDLRNQAPILLVEHDMDVVFKLADRITVLDYGRVIASGSVEDIRKNPVVQRAYLGENR
ncbi:ABC transporter ATP-binding protein [Ruegeria sp. R13_0]|uniref:ABC transporter ATP-binding protein n=1 Tax=Ruegeria sp. R13_0 TaxID=2821099 RepID=UPI001ADCBD1F|nr:ABC transporter ATP-binding protein [Ruegeria sp. R13_0]MBO9436323.1 ABC transporter ATP-binding protein [Ruegeria sp. R13_0]